MKISDRLYKLAELVDKGESVADIGTDHGYVPMLLIKNGTSPRVIMSDISEGSLSKAVETFKITGLRAGEDDFRIGDGLQPIKKSEVDAVIIAGLGGHTITDILDYDVEKSRSYKKLILQPRKHSGALRHYLYTHGWNIEREILSKEGKFECEIIVAALSGYEKREELYPSDDIRWKYPKLMAESNPSLAESRIKWKIGSIDEQIDNLKKSGRDKCDLITKLLNDRDYLVSMVSTE